MVEIGEKSKTLTKRDQKKAPVSLSASKKVNVTILCQYFYPENVTAASLPYEMAQYLIKNNCNVKVVAGMPQEYHDGNVAKSELLNGINIERIDYIYKNRSVVIGRIINNFSFFISIFRNRRKLKGADVVITYSSPPINPIIPAWLSKSYGFKLIYVAYDIYPDMAYKFGYLKYHGLVGTLFSKANDFVYKRCSKIVVLSDEMRRYFIDNIGYAEKVTIIPNWYLDANYKSHQAKVGGLNVLYGGNLGIVQDVDTMFGGIVSLKDHKKVKFYFAAHGGRLDTFFGEIKTQKITSVIKMGYMLKKKYDDFLSDVDIAIISLDKHMVGLASPSKFYSYIAKGKPVIFIGSKEMDVAKEIIKHKIGFVIDNGDVDGFKKIIIDLLKDKSCLNGMSMRARKLFEQKYTLDKCAGKYVDLINEVLKEKEI